MQKTIKIVDKITEDVTFKDGKVAQKFTFFDDARNEYVVWSSASKYSYDWAVGQDVTFECEPKEYQSKIYFQIKNPHRKPDNSKLILEKLDQILSGLSNDQGAPF